MKQVLLRLFFLCVFQSLFAFDLKESTVEVIGTTYQYNYFYPWSAPKTLYQQASGIVLDKGRIITSAKAVKNASYVDVRLAGDLFLFRASVISVDEEMQLACLEIQEETFLKKSYPVRISKQSLDHARSLSIHGFSPSQRRFSSMQVDVFACDLLDAEKNAAQTSLFGLHASYHLFSHGACLFAEDGFIGMALSSPAIFPSENYYKVVPTAAIQDFVESKVRKTFPIRYQGMHHPSLKAYYQLPIYLSGVLILEDYPPLKEGDILTSIQGEDVENDGTVILYGKKVSFQQLMHTYGVDQLLCEVWRSGEVKELDVPLQDKSQEHVFRQPPSYLIYAGLVFQPLHELEEECSIALSEENWIVLSKVLVDEVNADYARVAGALIESVNGIKISSLQEVEKALKDNSEEMHTIRTARGELLVLDKTRSEQSHLKILKKYGVLQSKLFPS